MAGGEGRGREARPGAAWFPPDSRRATNFKAAASGEMGEEDVEPPRPRANVSPSMAGENNQKRDTGKRDGVGAPTSSSHAYRKAVAVPRSLRRGLSTEVQW